MALPRTLLEALIQKLRGCNVCSDAEVAPVAILWTDPKREWLPLIPQLRSALPELISLGTYDAEQLQGPSLWLRCIVDRTLAEPPIPEGQIPILYLPGVSRQDLRAGEGCPWAWEPLIELMFLGTLWLQRNGRDWTLQAFLGSPDALGLDVASDQDTKLAMARALTELAMQPLAQLRGTRLEAKDFDAMLVDDPIRDLLRWMVDPSGFQQSRNIDQWNALVSVWKKDYKFDPSKDSELTAAERLATGKPEWEKVWRRFDDQPAAYPGLVDLLRRAAPPTNQVDLLGSSSDPSTSRWPHRNDAMEQEVQEALKALPKQPHAQACKAVRDLEASHGQRRQWIWAQLGLSPMAELLAPLGLLAQRADQPLVGTTPADFIAPYTESGCEADLAAWQAVAQARPEHEAMVLAAVAALLEPWLDDTAKRFQAAVQSHGLPIPVDQPAIAAPPGGCLLFADGLRYDVARQLQKRLEEMGITGGLTTRWAALPTVTATAKPAITPLIHLIQGQALPEDFAPSFRNGKATSAAELRKALEAEGYVVLADGALDLPTSAAAKGWLEIGDLDHRGHQLQDQLPSVIGPEIERLALRIQALLAAGWNSVQIVTDHGWLYCPGGLPSAQLPKHLTASKWARCAVIKGDSQVPVPTAAWSWNASAHFATPAGAACFNTGSTNSYAHGGISLQECLTPVLNVSGGSSVVAAASISAITWKGMRCYVEVAGGAEGLKADLRQGSPGGTSVANPKPIEDGSARLLVEDEELEGVALVMVLLGHEGRLIAQRQTRVGEDA
ncbi:MAG: BREX-1 system phosphatase PglZ type B [Cyanobium sp.]|nr:MAG: BREX-1 system phosphatase PglZ type B [Cyanobium sp.]